MRIERPVPLTTRPTVTVVVPHHNYGDYLPAAVASALDQRGLEVDVIIVDDCSTDGSVEVARRLADEHPQVRLLENPVNLRHIRTYNRGLAEAKGDYVVLLSADDLLAPDALTRACALMEAHPEVGLVYGYAPSFSDVPPPPQPARTWTTWSGDEWLRRISRRGDNIIVNPEAVLRGSLMRELVGYDVEHPHAADMLLWMRAARRMAVGRVNGVQAFYRDHGGNMHLTQFAGLATDMRERAALFDAFFGGEGDGADHPDAEALRAAGRRSIAREALWTACIAHDSGTSLGGGTADDLAALAVEVQPGVTTSRLHREWQARQSGSIGAVRRRALSMAHDLWWRARWRRWRRFGT